MGDEVINRELRLSEELDERDSLKDPDLVEVSRKAWLSDSSAKLERAMTGWVLWGLSIMMFGANGWQEQWIPHEEFETKKQCERARQKEIKQHIPLDKKHPYVHRPSQMYGCWPAGHDVTKWHNRTGESE